MLNLISISLCGALSSSVGLVPDIASTPQHLSGTSAVDQTHCLEQVTTLPQQTPIALGDVDGSSGSSDRRGADRRN